MPGLYSVYIVRTIQHLNYGGQESKKQSAVYDSDAPVTLKQDQGCQTWYEPVDTKQSCNNAKFEKSRLNSDREKANKKVFDITGNTSII